MTQAVAIRKEGKRSDITIFQLTNTAAKLEEI